MFIELGIIHFYTNCYYKYNDIINDEKYDWGKDSNLLLKQ